MRIKTITAASKLNICLLASAVVLASCVPKNVAVPQASQTALPIAQFETAQTHVLPEAGLTWSLSSTTGALHLTAQRNSLVMFDFGSANPIRPVLEAWQGVQKLGTLTLNAPQQLPAAEAAGVAYASNRYSATLPAAWVNPGVKLRVLTDNYAPSAYKQPNIGLDAHLDVRILPFYLFGANESNTQTYAVTGSPDAATTQELYAKWPVASLNIQNHPAQHANWPYFIIGPDGSLPAYRVVNKDQQHEGFAIMGAMLKVLGAMRNANGEGATNNQYYAPLLMLGANGLYSDPGGGLGTVGGSTATGDYRYKGNFFHEQGHAFGMPHAGEAYTAGKFPYLNGSLLGSSWGYDSTRNLFLPPFLPSNSANYATCQSNANRVKDSSGRCIKQDPMQGGSGDQASGDRYTELSDFNAGIIQQYFEGTTSVDSSGTHTYAGGKILLDSVSSTGYSRWDSVNKARVTFTPATTDKGLSGFDNGLPNVRNVPVQTVVLSYSLASTTEASQIYPTLAYQGNLRRQIDPTDPLQTAQITPNTGTFPWYCHASGCDYTVRVSYADGSLQHVLLQGGFRAWFKPFDVPAASAYDPNNGNSFKIWAVNVPASKAIVKVELLDTPMGWNGIGSNPVVLLSRSL